VIATEEAPIIHDGMSQLHDKTLSYEYLPSLNFKEYNFYAVYCFLFIIFN
jgi:hypothetical protein